jgi:hypothetical protein
VDIEEALTAFIPTRAALAALVGSRFGFDEVPAKTALPYMIIQCISDIPTHTHDGQSDMYKPYYQFTAYGRTRLEAKAVAKQIKAAFCDFVGTMSGIEVKYITLENSLPGTLESADGTVKIPYVALEFQIVYKE